MTTRERATRRVLAIGKIGMPFAVWLKRGVAIIGTREFLELLNRIPRWRRINQAPERIDSLESRVNRLEAQIDLLLRKADFDRDSHSRSSGS